MKTGLALCLFLLLAWAQPLMAADLAGFDQAVDQARQALQKGDAAGTMEALSRASSQAFKNLRFTAIHASLAAAPPTGYGQFIPRVDNVYRPGEPLIIYMEPVGYEVRWDEKSRSYRYRITADFNLVDAWGMVVGGRRGFGRFEGDSKQFPDRLPLTFTYSLAGLPPGKYRVETILHDALGKKSHTVSTEIVVSSH